MYSEYGNVYGMSIMGEDELVICARVYDTVLVSYSYVYLSTKNVKCSTDALILFTVPIVHRGRKVNFQ